MSGYKAMAIRAGSDVMSDKPLETLCKPTTEIIIIYDSLHWPFASEASTVLIQEERRVDELLQQGGYIQLYAKCVVTPAQPENATNM